MESKKLLQFGLTDYESRAYVCVVAHGKVKASQIAASSGVPYGKIYPVLSSLQKKGFIKIIISNNIKHFLGIPPRIAITNMLNLKQKEISNLEKKLFSILNDFDKVLDIQKDQVEFVKTIEGRQNYQQFSISLHNDTKTKWYSINHLPITKNYVQANIKVLSNANIDSRILVVPSKNLEKRLKIYSRFKKSLRILNETSPRFTLKDKNDVVLRMNEPNFKNYVSVWLNNPALNKSLSKVFLELWKRSKKVK